jgi:hypothetical protein
LVVVPGVLVFVPVPIVVLSNPLLVFPVPFTLVFVPVVFTPVPDGGGVVVVVFGLLRLWPAVPSVSIFCWAFLVDEAEVLLVVVPLVCD